jgi:hypothetical protein
MSCVAWTPIIQLLRVSLLLDDSARLTISEWWAPGGATKSPCFNRSCPWELSWLERTVLAHNGKSRSCFVSLPVHRLVESSEVEACRWPVYEITLELPSADGIYTLNIASRIDLVIPSDETWHDDEVPLRRSPTEDMGSLPPSESALAQRALRSVFLFPYQRWSDDRLKNSLNNREITARYSSQVISSWPILLPANQCQCRMGWSVKLHLPVFADKIYLVRRKWIKFERLNA